MNRDMQLAEAVRDAVCNSISAFLPENKQRVVDNFGREVNLAAIIASVEAPEPVAWRVMVRDSKTEWRQYALYETEKAAQSTVKKVEGDPLQVMAQPLYAAPQPAWQPIETAPKDGTAVLLANDCGVWIGKYVPVYQSGFAPAIPWFSLMLNHDHVGNKSCAPTHWMPIPEMPKE